MAVDAYRITVATTATELTAADTNTFGEDRGTASTILVKNPASGVDVAVGGSDVTFATGLIVKALESLPVTLQKGDRLYGIVTSGTQVVHVLRTGV